MRPVEFPATDLAEVLRRQKIATIDEAMAALGTSSKSTVFRKLSKKETRVKRVRNRKLGSRLST